MYKLYPYFTNDGTVGLFSQTDDDIYHSTYGALTESWQKFVIPSRLQDFVKHNESVRILDICYGIGYNTKTALNVFVENYLEENKNKNKKIEKKVSNFLKNNDSVTSSIAAIDTDNIPQDESGNFESGNSKNDEIYNELSSNKVISNEAIDADNISDLDSYKNGQDNEKKCSNSCTKILIDAVDTDGILIELSPFIKIMPVSRTMYDLFYAPSFKDYNPNDSSRNVLQKTVQIEKIQRDKFNKLKKEYRIRKEVPIILLEKLLENSKNVQNDQSEISDNLGISKITEQIMQDNKNIHFFSDYMLNFASFLLNLRSNNTSGLNKTSLLHNIYYRYVSKSYKNAQEVLRNAQVDVNLNKIDARAFIKSTNNQYDFIFLDAFTPAKCPALWTIDFFKELHSKLADDGMILTYSNSAAIRNALLQNGFVVGKIYDKNLKKFIGTIAAKNGDLVEYKLNSYDMGLINSRAGICYRDETLDADNTSIIKNRNFEVEQSELVSSSQYLKGHKNAKPV